MLITFSGRMLIPKPASTKLTIPSIELSTVFLYSVIPFELNQVSSLDLKTQPFSKNTIFKGSSLKVLSNLLRKIYG